MKPLTLLLPLILLFSHCSSPPLYEVSYQVYPYFYEDNSYGRGSGQIQTQIWGWTEGGAVENLKTYLYLNCITVGDSVEIVEVEKL